MNARIAPDTFALVTGGSSGIGRAIAEQLALQGYHLLLVALPGHELEEAAGSLANTTGCRVYTFETDLCRENADMEVAGWVQSLQVPVSVLVNNAGMGYVGSYTDFDHHFYRDLLRINITNLVGITTLMIRELERNQPAYILNLGSMASFFPLPWKTVYAASKAFVFAYSAALREELRTKGISVTVVCPGAVTTSENVRARIEASGRMGMMTALSPGRVAKKSVEGMLRKRKMVLPGISPKFSWYLGRRLPGIVRKVIVKRLLSGKKPD
ncbi:MAG TPA: SDR family NAD(P)-dependent oxidoreductase [Bacteroidales bacterium]|nr:SDR family NAD(P)-dependent oxidoreductase [Bacteroidales bacterium]HRZ50079.1 SDR family NAD(P)-dependent oxidoreductase [Bacteroidales bacterium]